MLAPDTKLLTPCAVVTLLLKELSSCKLGGFDDNRK
jgi:hypothetical protein